MAQSLELLILQFLMPDDDARRQAEDQIKRMVRDPTVVPVLIDHIRTAKTPNVRQLSAVLLRKKIKGHWPNLLPELRQLVMQSLIESIATENRLHENYYCFWISFLDFIMFGDVILHFPSSINFFIFIIANCNKVITWLPTSWNTICMLKIQSQTLLVYKRSLYRF